MPGCRRHHLAGFSPGRCQRGCGVTSDLAGGGLQPGDLNSSRHSCGFVKSSFAKHRGSHRFCLGDSRTRTPGLPPFSSTNLNPADSNASRTACSRASRLTARALRGPSAPLGPRLWDEELALPGDNARFASERNSSETRFATHEVSPRIRAILGKSDARA